MGDEKELKCGMPGGDTSFNSADIDHGNKPQQGSSGQTPDILIMDSNTAGIPPLELTQDLNAEPSPSTAQAP